MAAEVASADIEDVQVATGDWSCLGLKGDCGSFLHGLLTSPQTNHCQGEGLPSGQ